MSAFIRNGKADVVIAAGPRVRHWPSAGVRALSTACAEAGLSVSLFGGDALRVRGVIPLPSTGGIVLIEDIQKRIHRIEARACVRVSAEPQFPDPFPGWNSQGLIPYETALKLRSGSQVAWEPATVVLGSGNKALRFASSLLQSGVSQVLCVESNPQWSAKRFAGWEVEKRRFEMLGGKILEASLVSLTPKAALVWQLRLKDHFGVRVLDVGRVVSVGPYRESEMLREFPAGSFLFEITQTAEEQRDADVEGWVLEEERGRWLASRIIRTLVGDLGDRREEVDRIYRRARGRLKRYLLHREHPFTPAYQGKWVAPSDSRAIRAFSGVPQTEYFQKAVASIECFEEIPCDVCAQTCPTQAITIGKVPRKEKILNEDRCNSCGLCVNACPSQAISLIREFKERSLSELTLPAFSEKKWKPGDFGTLLNRRGESLGSARVLETPTPESPTPGSSPHSEKALLKLEVPSHLVWEARAIRPLKTSQTEDRAYLEAVARSAPSSEKVEISVNGEKRLVRDGVQVTTALFEMGQGRFEDVLFCPDGSCGLCQILVDGVKKLACQTQIHKGMAIKQNFKSETPGYDDILCPCLGITRTDVMERMKQGNLRSAEAVLSSIHVGEGKCHGQFCSGNFKRLLSDLNQGEGDSSRWIDWRFPWSDWSLSQFGSQ